MVFRLSAVLLFPAFFVVAGPGVPWEPFRPAAAVLGAVSGGGGAVACGPGDGSGAAAPLLPKGLGMDVTWGISGVQGAPR